MDVRRLPALVAVLLLCTACTTPEPHGTFPATVVEILDGDSIIVQTDSFGVLNIRLDSIDAPEFDQHHGAEATLALREMIGTHSLVITAMEIDKYGRTIASVHIDSFWVNEAMVAQGHAWAYTQYLRHPHFTELEESARESGLGLWAEPSPLPPWEHRRSRRSPAP